MKNILVYIFLFFHCSVLFGASLDLKETEEAILAAVLQSSISTSTAAAAAAAAAVVEVEVEEEEITPFQTEETEERFEKFFDDKDIVDNKEIGHIIPRLQNLILYFPLVCNEELAGDPVSQTIAEELVQTR